MLEIYNLKDKQIYIEEVATITQKEWGQKDLSKEEIKELISADEYDSRNWATRHLMAGPREDNTDVGSPMVVALKAPIFLL